MKIVLGTYEGNLISWESDFHADPSGQTLRLAYAFNAHSSSVRCLAFDNSPECNLLVSGSADESIKIFDLGLHKEIGSLLEHKDAVSCCKFYGVSHMVSSARDGGICVWRTHDWLPLDTMRGHKSAVNYISIHPSGKLASSVGSDKTLHLWDLTKGKHAYKTKLPVEAMQIHWTSDGTKFVVVFEAGLIVCDGRTGAELYKLPLDKGRRVCDAAVFTHVLPGKKKSEKEFVVAGMEGGDVCLWSVDNTMCIILATGHAKRTRCVAYTEGAGSGRPSTAPKAYAADKFSGESLSPLSKLAGETKKLISIPTNEAMLVTADSEGIIKLWDFNAILKHSDDGGKPVMDLPALVTLTAAAGSRTTSLAVSPHSSSGREAAPSTTTTSGPAVTSSAKAAGEAKAPVSGKKRSKQVVATEVTEEAPPPTSAAKKARKSVSFAAAKH